MQRMEAPAGAARTLALAVVVVLAGILIGRLVLEPSGTGLALLLVAVPVLFLLLALLLGVGRAALLVTLFAATALLVRVIALRSGWVVLLLAPVIGMTLYILARTVLVMRGPAPQGKSAAAGGEEE